MRKIECPGVFLKYDFLGFFTFLFFQDFQTALSVRKRQRLESMSESRTANKFLEMIGKGQLSVSAAGELSRSFVTWWILIVYCTLQRWEFSSNSSPWSFSEGSNTCWSYWSYPTTCFKYCSSGMVKPTKSKNPFKRLDTATLAHGIKLFS